MNLELLPRIKDIWHRNNLTSGIEIIDIQHLWLIKIIAELEEAGEQTDVDKKDEATRFALKQCIEYVIEHFTIEELLLQLVQFEELSEHRIEHHSFIKDLTKQAAEFNGSNEGVLSKLIGHLYDWLVEHISLTDQKYNQLVKEKLSEVDKKLDKIMADRSLILSKDQIELYQHVLGVEYREI